MTVETMIMWLWILGTVSCLLFALIFREWRAE